MNVLESVELQASYMYDCLECGTENFVRVITFDGIEEETLKKCYITKKPNTVKCNYCKKSFQTRYHGD